MDIKMYFDGELIFASLTLTHKGKMKQLNRMVVDTGAAKSFISVDLVDDIGLTYSNGDRIFSMYGVGGLHDSFRKIVDIVEFGSKKFENYSIDFGTFKIDVDVNGLIGLDLLKDAEITLDLKNMKMFET